MLLLEDSHGLLPALLFEDSVELERLFYLLLLVAAGTCFGAKASGLAAPSSETTTTSRQFVGSLRCNLVLEEFLIDLGLQSITLGAEVVGGLEVFISLGYHIVVVCQGARSTLPTEIVHVLVDVYEFFETLYSLVKSRYIDIFGLHGGSIGLDHLLEHCNFILLLLQSQLQILNSGLGQLPNLNFGLHEFLFCFCVAFICSSEGGFLLFEVSVLEPHLVFDGAGSLGCLR